MTCVDYLSDLSETANKFDLELKAASDKAAKNLSQRNTGNSLAKLTKASSKQCCEKLESETLAANLNQGPRHVTICIDNELDSKTFEATLFGEGVPDFGIVGLHTCGDLGPNLVSS